MNDRTPGKRVIPLFEHRECRAFAKYQARPSGGKRAAGSRRIVRVLGRQRSHGIPGAQHADDQGRFGAAGHITSTSPCWIRRAASPRATADDEQAVEYVNIGP